MKKHSFKKILALLIAIIMVIPAIPVVATAEDATTTTYTYQTPTATEAEINAWLATETDGVITIDNKQELICFMALGAVAHDTTNGADAARFSNKTISLTADITWNDGEATADGFVPAKSQNNVIYTWTPYWQSTTKTAKTVESVAEDGTITYVKDSKGKDKTTSLVSNYYGFRGTFEGNGHTINGIVVNGDSGAAGDYGAFFKRVGNNAKINDVKFENTYVTGRRYISGLIATTQGSGIKIDGVKMSGHISGSTHVGGLLGTPDIDGEKRTITITNCFVDAHVSARELTAGGFIAATSKHTVTISNSISVATVSATGTRTTGQVCAGGFIGTSEAVTTMTNCQFLGTVSGTNNFATAAFATITDVTQSGFPAVTASAPDAHYAATFTDCYYASGSANHALGAYHRNSGTENNWYDLTVDYTGDKVEAVPVDLTTLYGTGEGQTTGQDATAGLISASFNTYYLDTSAKQGANAIGAQMGSNNNARIVATVAGNANITKVEFVSISLTGYMNSVTETKSRPYQSYEPAQKTKCGYAYKSLKANYGLETIAAGENEYLVALGITGISATEATTILVRPVYWDKTVDESTASGFAEDENGNVKETKQYGNYMGIIFYDGDILGCFYMN